MQSSGDIFIIIGKFVFFVKEGSAFIYTQNEN